MEITICDAKKLRGFGFSRTFANRIEALRDCLFVEEDLIEHTGMSQYIFANMWHAHNNVITSSSCIIPDKGGVGLKAKHLEKIIKHGFVLRLHGTPINWNRLLKVLRYQRLSPSQREKEENKAMDDEMKGYWNSAVGHVEDATVTHPGDLIDQSFVHARLMKIHEVVCL